MENFGHLVGAATLVSVIHQKTIEGHHRENIGLFAVADHKTSLAHSMRW